MLFVVINRGSVCVLFCVACHPRPVWTYFIMDHCSLRHAPWIFNTLYVPALPQGKSIWPGWGQSLNSSRGCVCVCVCNPTRPLTEGRWEEEQEDMWWCAHETENQVPRKKNKTQVVKTKLKLKGYLLPCSMTWRRCVLLLCVVPRGFQQLIRHIRDRQTQ